eukprot:14082276-Heterocapsa_arctica.AAC.1
MGGSDKARSSNWDWRASSASAAEVPPETIDWKSTQEQADDQRRYEEEKEIRWWRCKETLRVRQEEADERSR